MGTCPRLRNDCLTEEASYVMNRMRERGILLGTDGLLSQRAQDSSADAARRGKCKFSFFYDGKKT